MAIGSRDKSLSVWVLPRVKRPVVVLQRLFKHSVTDLAWRGTDLVVSSQDGSIKYLSFREKELGTMLSPQKMVCSLASFLFRFIFIVPIAFDNIDDDEVWRTVLG